MDQLDQLEVVDMTLSDNDEHLYGANASMETEECTQDASHLNQKKKTEQNNSLQQSSSSTVEELSPSFSDASRVSVDEQIIGTVHLNQNGSSTHVNIGANNEQIKNDNPNNGYNGSSSSSSNEGRATRSRNSNKSNISNSTSSSLSVSNKEGSNNNMFSIIDVNETREQEESKYSFLGNNRSVSTSDNLSSSSDEEETKSDHARKRQRDEFESKNDDEKQLSDNQQANEEYDNDGELDESFNDDWVSTDPYRILFRPCTEAGHWKMETNTTGIKGPKKHQSLKKSNCQLNPNCLFGLGEYKEGIWLEEKSNFIRKIADGEKVDLLREDMSMPCGLRNLGATCYVNTILQCLFMVSKFRTMVFNWRASKEKECDLDQQEKQMLELYKIFARLDRGKRLSYNPVEFIASLQIGAHIQQDAQEFHKLLMSFLEAVLKSDSLSTNCFSSIFRGKTVYTTTCSKCKNKSRSETFFQELEIQIRGKKSVNECLKAYVIQEELKDSNKYFCSTCDSKQDAVRNTEIAEMPEVLNLQLMRLYYDVSAKIKRKTKDAIEIPPTLDFAQFPELLNEEMKKEATSKGLVYDLICIIHHHGPTADSGHYTVDVYDEGKSKSWWRLDDTNVKKLEGGAGVVDEQSVEVVDVEEVVEAESVESSPTKKKKKSIISSSKKSSSASTSTSSNSEVKIQPPPKGSRDAYMLVYQRRTASSDATEREAAKCKLIPFVEEEINKENEEIIQSSKYYMECRDRKMKEIKARQELYEKIFRPIRNGGNNLKIGKTQSMIKYWIPTDWLKSWITGENCIDNQDKNKEPDKDIQMVVDITDEVIDAEKAVSDKLEIFDGPINNSKYLCEHGQLDPKAAYTKMKLVPEKVWKDIKENRTVDMILECNIELKNSVPTYTCEKSCAVCVDNMIKESKKQKLTSSNIQKAKNIIEKYFQSKMKKSEYLMLKDYSHDNPLVYLSTKWVTQWKNHVKLFESTMKTQDESLRSGRVNQGKKKRDQSILSFIGPGEDDLPLDVNKYIICPHDRLLPEIKFESMKERRLIKEKDWKDFIESISDSERNYQNSRVFYATDNDCVECKRLMTEQQFEQRGKWEEVEEYLGAKGNGATRKALLESKRPAIKSLSDALIQTDGTGKKQYFLASSDWMLKWRLWLQDPNTNPHPPSLDNMYSHLMESFSCPCSIHADNMEIDGRKYFICLNPRFYDWLHGKVHVTDVNFLSEAAKIEILSKEEWLNLPFNPSDSGNTEGISISVFGAPDASSPTDKPSEDDRESRFVNLSGNTVVIAPRVCERCLARERDDAKVYFDQPVLLIPFGNEITPSEESVRRSTRVKTTTSSRRKTRKPVRVIVSSQDSIEFFRLKVLQSLDLENPRSIKLYYAGSRIDDSGNKTLFELGILAGDELYYQIEAVNDEDDIEAALLASSNIYAAEFNGKEKGFMGTALVSSGFSSSATTDSVTNIEVMEIHE